MDAEKAKPFGSMLDVREIVAGNSWMAASFGDGHLPRCIMCCGGCCFLGAMPVAQLASMAAEADGIEPDALDLTRVADELASLSLEQLTKYGGHYLVLHPGEGALIPQGWMFFQCSSGYMLADAAFMKRNGIEKDSGGGVTCLVAWLLVTLSLACLCCDCGPVTV